jgi:hypothetical protein
MDEIAIHQALQELDTTLADLLRQSKMLPKNENSSAIDYHHHWNPLRKPLLFSKIDVDAQTQAAVLRGVPENIPLLRPSKQVFILPSTGYIFTIDEAGLQWHHICKKEGGFARTMAWAF